MFLDNAAWQKVVQPLFEKTPKCREASRGVHCHGTELVLLLALFQLVWLKMTRKKERKLSCINVENYNTTFNHLPQKSQVPHERSCLMICPCYSHTTSCYEVPSLASMNSSSNYLPQVKGINLWWQSSILFCDRKWRNPRRKGGRNGTLLWREVTPASLGPYSYSSVASGKTFSGLSIQLMQMRNCQSFEGKGIWGIV